MKQLSRSVLISIAFAMLLLVSCGPSAPAAQPSPGSTPVSVPVTGDTPSAPEAGPGHTLIPAALPPERSSHAGDQDSSSMADKKQAPGGDQFTLGNFERPFNADTMDVYFPYLDIQDVYIYQDDTWVYAALTVKGTDANGGLPGKYALELDLDADGRGDWFLLVEHPQSTDWSTDGLALWNDANGDVGGEIVIKADKAPSAGDGYETLVLGHGQGDPDGVWARIAPDDPNTVQLAVKRSLLNSPSTYLAGLWTGNEDLNPALFDLSDHFTHEQAGAALTDFEFYYPIKQLSELDNTCRMAIGFEPTGLEPGVCTPPGAQRPGCKLSDAICNQTCTYGGALDPNACKCICSAG